MSQRRKRKYDEESVSSSTKRPRYDYNRDFYSLPQYDKPTYHHKYDLRSCEHRKPVDYYSYSQSSRSQATARTKPEGRVCAHITSQNVHSYNGRNAHSYSINALNTRYSNSSASSSHKCKQQQVLRNDSKLLTAKLDHLPPPSVTRPRRKRNITREEDVSHSMM